MDLNLKNKHILITGGSKGIGITLQNVVGGAVVAGDAFFPFADGLEVCAVSRLERTR